MTGENEVKDSFEQFFNKTPMGVHMYQLKSDGQLIFTGANQAADKILGVDNTNFIGKTIEEAFPPLAETDVPDRYRKVASTGKPWYTEQIAYEDRGISGVFEVHAFQTSPGKMAAMFTDITARKLAKEALTRYAVELEESNNIKDLFTDIMRHDLLNPANVARTMAEIALQEEEDPNIKEVLTTIFDANERIVELIEDASLFASLNEEKKISLKKMDLTPVIKHAEGVVKPMAEKKNVTLDLNIERSHFAVANPVIYHVFYNLLSNAVKYSPNGSTISVVVEDVDAGLLASFSDSGIGVLDADKEAIFERFTRVDKGGVEGAGLGLAIVKRVVDGHGGRVWVEDNPGGGSIFKVLIPASQ